MIKNNMKKKESKFILKYNENKRRVAKNYLDVFVSYIFFGEN